MPYPRTKDEIDALEPTAPERKLLEACRLGGACELGPDRPEGPSEARTIRAEILRYVILGGCPAHPGTERGVWLVGAHIAGALDLDWATARGPVGLALCDFAQVVYATDATLPALALFGCRVPGLNVERARIASNLALRAQGKVRFQAMGAVSLAGVRIGGQLSCEGGAFDTAGGVALNAQGAEIGEAVFLRAQGELPFRASGAVHLAEARIGGQLTCTGGSFENADGVALNVQGTEIAGGVFLQAQGKHPFLASGEVCLHGARIGGQLSCAGGRFKNPGRVALNAERAEIEGSVFLEAQGKVLFRASGEVRLSGARIGGQLGCSGGAFENADGVALSLQKARIEDGLIWREVRAGAGVYNLHSAHAAVLVDDLDHWPQAGLDLDGFSYDRIVGETGAGPRLKWLARGTRIGGAFYPQPYGQLARVLREMGHGSAAREILFERERLLRREVRKQAVFLRPLLWLWHALEKVVVGYGLKPWRSVGVFLLLWLGCFLLAGAAWRAGEMAPNAGPLLSQPEWRAAFETYNPPVAWSATAVGTSWEKFNAGAYAFDVVVPLIEIGQVSAWGPLVDDAEGTGWGRALWVANWGFSVGGWVVALLATAGLTGALSSRKD